MALAAKRRQVLLLLCILRMLQYLLFACAQVDGVISLPHWKHAGWKTLSGKKLKNQDLWRQLDEELNALQTSGKRVVLKHVPAETEIGGNQSTQRLELRQLLRQHARVNRSRETFEEPESYLSEATIDFAVSDGAAYARSVSAFTCPLHTTELQQGAHKSSSSSS